jgi:hypothetical protein
MMDTAQTQRDEQALELDKVRDPHVPSTGLEVLIRLALVLIQVNNQIKEMER